METQSVHVNTTLGHDLDVVQVNLSTQLPVAGSAEHASQWKDVSHVPGAEPDGVQRRMVRAMCGLIGGVAAGVPPCAAMMEGNEQQDDDMWLVFEPVNGLIAGASDVWVRLVGPTAAYENSSCS